ncbi:uncharacterized protein EMH_0048330 [Eimeria mitis]|uniref:Uncharacterized protein n=1 Tax=Eimeria mitis TaxID=44415 RepID=U6JUX5_9EIME|nr:uncharacterized protein EMH_0048330 [Eimeria mitis]CDJ29275.1 hypothetical protein, conserved [Eimeria mitis]
MAPGAPHEAFHTSFPLPSFFRRHELTSSRSHGPPAVSAEHRFPQTSVGFYLDRRRQKVNRKNADAPRAPKHIDMHALLQRLHESAMQQPTVTASVATLPAAAPPAAPAGDA